MTWNQNMDESPKDGTRVLVRFTNGEVHAVNWVDDGFSGGWFNGYWAVGKQLEAKEWTEIP